MRDKVSTAGSISNLAGGGQITATGITAGTGTAGAIGAGIGVGLGGPIGAGIATGAASLASGYSCYKTHHHIKNLEVILAECKSGKTYSCECEDSQNQHYHDALPKIIEFIIEKKQKKRVQKGVGVVPVAGSLGTTAYQAARSAYKIAQGTRGVDRSEYAHMLGTHLVRSKCELAEQIVLELVGGYDFQHVYTCNTHDAALILFEKMNI